MLNHISILIGAIFISAALTAFGQILVITAMRFGNQVATFIIANAAIIYPFIGSIFVGDEARAFAEWLGLIFVFLGVIGVALSQRPTNQGIQPPIQTNKTFNYWKWLTTALVGCLFLGLGQISSMVPSLRSENPDPAGLRLPLMLTFLALSYLTITLSKLRKRSQFSWRYSVIWGVLALTSYFLLFRTLDLARISLNTGLVYPLATGISIFCYTIISCVTTKTVLNYLSILGAVLILVGLFLMALQ